MIEVIARNGPPEAMLCPAFICDTCREQVVKRGNVIHCVRYVDGRREVSPVFVAHKGVCDRALKAHLDKLYPLDEGWSESWDELRDFVRYLTNNAENAFADDPEGEYLPHQVVFVGDEQGGQ